MLLYWVCTRYCTVLYKVKPPQLCHSSSLGSVLSVVLPMPPWRKLCCRTGCSSLCKRAPVRGHFRKWVFLSAWELQNKPAEVRLNACSKNHCQQCPWRRSENTLGLLLPWAAWCSSRLQVFWWALMGILSSCPLSAYPLLYSQPFSPSTTLVSPVGRRTWLLANSLPIGMPGPCLDFWQVYYFHSIL